MKEILELINRNENFNSLFFKSEINSECETIVIKLYCSCVMKNELKELILFCDKHYLHFFIFSWNENIEIIISSLNMEL